MIVLTEPVEKYTNSQIQWYYKDMSYKKICEVCGKNFTSTQPHTLVCGDECKKTRNAKILGRESYFSDLTSPTVGAISEMTLATDLMKNGYAVFRALSASCFCDLIAIKDEKTLKIEARTGYGYSNRVSFPKNTHGEIDVFAVYVASENKCYYYEKDAKTPYKI